MLTGELWQTYLCLYNLGKMFCQKWDFGKEIQLCSGIQKTFRKSFQKQVSGILRLSEEEKYNSDWLQAKKNCFSESVQLPMNRWENCAYMCVPSDFIRFSGEKERLCGIFSREQAVRYHRGECGISLLKELIIRTPELSLRIREV